MYGTSPKMLTVYLPWVTHRWCSASEWMQSLNNIHACWFHSFVLCVCRNLALSKQVSNLAYCTCVCVCVSLSHLPSSPNSLLVFAPASAASRKPLQLVCCTNPLYLYCLTANFLKEMNIWRKMHAPGAPIRFPMGETIFFPGHQSLNALLCQRFGGWFYFSSALSIMGMNPGKCWAPPARYCSSPVFLGGNRCPKYSELYRCL